MDSRAAIFFRDWLKLRIVAAYGIVPDLILDTLCYSLYHLEYKISPAGMLFLFDSRLVFEAAFQVAWRGWSKPVFDIEQMSCWNIWQR